MRSLTVFVIVILYTVQTFATSVAKCPANEVFKIRWRPERNCAVDAPRTVSRTKVCTCLPNLVRNGTGSCIPRSECPICDDPNEFYSYCARIFGPMCLVAPCPSYCISECICIDGYIKNRDFLCVSKDLCTGYNEAYTECMPRTCPPGMACPAVCIPGCDCIYGFEKNESGDCIRIQKPASSRPPSSTSSPL